MANKRQIAEQVQRIVNGGSNSDDSKVTLREVMALVEQERDAMIKKHIMENAVDLEVPNKVDYESGDNWGNIKWWKNIMKNF